MTLTQFLETEVLSTATQFFGELPQDAANPERRVTRRVDVIPARSLAAACAVAAALTILPVHPSAIAATRAKFEIESLGAAAAAVHIPGLSGQQVQAARVLRAAFEPIEAGLDATGDDPDYGF